MITFDDIKEQHDAGQTAADIAATLAADPRHVRDIMAVDFDAQKLDLYDVLEGHDLLDGSLEAAIDAQGSPELSAAFQKLMRHMQTVNRHIRCGTVPAVGQLCSMITAIAKQLKPDDAAAIQTDMDALTGGPRFADVTAADITGLIDAQAIADAVQSVANVATLANEAAAAEARTETATADSVTAAANAVLMGGV